MTVRWDWDTRNNREAEAGSTIQGDNVAVEIGADGNVDYLQTARYAASTAERYMSANLRYRWSRSYAAFQSKHFEASKYNSKRYRGRTSLFRPKTRMAVRRADAAVGAAFFATHDVVQMSAEDDSDPLQLAGAKLQHELMNMRLDRANTEYGIPWFLTVIGAHQDAKISGICASKQEWKYDEEITAWEDEVYTDPDTGQEYSERVPVTRQTESRPDVTLFAPEMVLRDPAANWIDQAQFSSFIILKYPMSVGEVKARIKKNNPIGQGWKEVTEDAIRKSVVDLTNAGVRRSREGKGLDRYDDAYQSIRDYETVWVHENFMRIDGQDLHFWSLGVHAMLTDARPVRDVYPEQKGRRPIVVGYGQIESHKIDPQSHVESLQPLQQEVNDVVNLRLDNIKQNMSPVTKVRRGRNVDISQVQNRSPDSVIMMNALDDVEWDRPPDVSSSAYVEMSNLETDMDDVGGTFSSSSVQSNRQLNETVGGMQLLNQNANTLGEFDIRVFNETWMEPVLRQLANLNAYYENDPNIINLAGKKAGLWDQYIEGMTDLDGLLLQNVQLRVDAGMGASDPMQRLQRFRMGAETIAVVGGEQAMSMVNMEAVIEEVFGILGFKDGKRFFNVDDAQDPQQMMMMQQLEMAMKEIERLEFELKDGQADRENAVLLQRIKSATDLVKELMETERQKFSGQIQQQAQILTHNSNMNATRQRADQASQQMQLQQQRDRQQAQQKSERPALA